MIKPRTSEQEVGGGGWGFDTYLSRVVSLSKDTFTPRKVLVIPRKRWLCPDMTEILFTGTLSLITKPKGKNKNNVIKTDR